VNFDPNFHKSAHVILAKSGQTFNIKYAHEGIFWKNINLPTLTKNCKIVMPEYSKPESSEQSFPISYHILFTNKDSEQLFEHSLKAGMTSENQTTIKDENNKEIADVGIFINLCKEVKN
jgi:hypothetical protein